jgi:L-fuconolactonase
VWRTLDGRRDDDRGSLHLSQLVRVEEEVIEIIDAQIHEPEPSQEWKFGAESHLALSVEPAREAIDCVGVDVALINSTDDFCEAAMSAYPDRFAACGRLDAKLPDLDDAVAHYRDRPGYLAVRTGIRNWKDGTVSKEHLEGGLEPLFKAAGRHNLPLFLSGQAVCKHVEPIARNPDLLVILDRVAHAQQPMPVGPDPWFQLPIVNSPAPFPNVAVKFSGALHLSNEPYPHHDSGLICWRWSRPTGGTASCGAAISPASGCPPAASSGGPASSGRVSTATPSAFTGTPTSSRNRTMRRSLA